MLENWIKHEFEMNLELAMQFGSTNATEEAWEWTYNSLVNNFAKIRENYEGD